jgi:hypothetical protein
MYFLIFFSFLLILNCFHSKNEEIGANLSEKIAKMKRTYRLLSRIGVSSKGWKLFQMDDILGSDPTVELIDTRRLGQLLRTIVLFLLSGQGLKVSNR